MEEVQELLAVGVEFLDLAMVKLEAEHPISGLISFLLVWTSDVRPVLIYVDPLSNLQKR